VVGDLVAFIYIYRFSVTWNGVVCLILSHLFPCKLRFTIRALGDVEEVLPTSRP